MGVFCLLVLVFWILRNGSEYQGVKEKEGVMRVSRFARCQLGMGIEEERAITHQG